MKFLFALGLILQLFAQVMLSLHSEQFNLLEPYDYIHLMLLLGLVLIIPHCLNFTTGFLQAIGGSISLVGIVCGIGMCVIDLVLWTYRGDIPQRDTLVAHLMQEPIVWTVFVTAGPALMFIGLAIQSLKFIDTKGMSVLCTIGGAAMVGISQVAFQDYRVVFLASYLLFIAGLINLSSKSSRQLFNNLK